MCGIENSDNESVCFNCFQSLGTDKSQLQAQYQSHQQSSGKSYMDQYYPVNPSQNFNQNATQHSTPVDYSMGRRLDGSTTAQGQTTHIAIPVQSTESFDGTPQIKITNPNFYIQQSTEKSKTKLIIAVVVVIAIIILAGLALSFSGSTNNKQTIFSDKDNDGVPDENDAFPYDQAESKDSDADGLGDNADAFPYDPTESMDSDGDGNGDNVDLDDDNDGILDSVDEFPKNSTEWADWDDDNVGDNSDQFLVKALTSASMESDDSNFSPCFKNVDVYYVTYNWWLLSDPPYVNSQDINKYNNSSGDTTSMFHDDEKTSQNVQGTKEVELIHEIAVSPSSIYFTQDNMLNEDGTQYYGFSRPLYKLENNQVSTVRGCGLHEYCYDISTYNNQVVYVFESNNAKFVYSDKNPFEIEGPDAFDPDIDSSGIVYIYQTSNGSVVRYYSDSVKTNITELTAGVSFRRPKIHHGNFVYERIENEVSNIYYFNKGSNSHSELTNSFENDKLLDFDGKFALFTRYSDKSAIKGVYVVDVFSGEEKRIYNSFVDSGEINGNYFTVGYSQNIYFGLINKN
jgi:hypothetical protein